jgi:TfoX/Sxy family transcriptional regulator of competence genes
MASEPRTAEYISDQLGALDVRTARMFGEFAVYCDGKVVGFICDDTLFIKPSGVDPAVLVGTYLAPPHARAKDYHAVPGELLEDRDWLQTAIRSTADALPAPTPKKPKAARTSRTTS